MRTLNLKEAAAFLNMHPETLKEKARAGIIPGAKIGRRWVFIEIDLLDYIRSQYRRQALQGDHTEKLICHSSNAKTRLFGGSNSPTTEAEYSKVLALPIRRKLGSTTTS
jgi:hypothetical protein